MRRHVSRQNRKYQYDKKTRKTVTPQEPRSRRRRARPALLGHLAAERSRDLVRERAHARVVARDEGDVHAAAPLRVRAHTDVVGLDARLEVGEVRRDARLGLRGEDLDAQGPLRCRREREVRREAVEQALEEVRHAGEDAQAPVEAHDGDAELLAHEEDLRARGEECHARERGLLRGRADLRAAARGARGVEPAERLRVRRERLRERGREGLVRDVCQVSWVV
jgi:hypothetical protein